LYRYRNIPCEKLIFFAWLFFYAPLVFYKETGARQMPSKTFNQIVIALALCVGFLGVTACQQIEDESPKIKTEIFETRMYRERQQYTKTPTNPQIRALDKPPVESKW
jgi:hypothetical protein